MHFGNGVEHERPAEPGDGVCKQEKSGPGILWSVLGNETGVASPDVRWWLWCGAGAQPQPWHTAVPAPAGADASCSSHPANLLLFQTPPLLGFFSPRILNIAFPFLADGVVNHESLLALL